MVVFAKLSVRPLPTQLFINIIDESSAHRIALALRNALITRSIVFRRWGARTVHHHNTMLSSRTFVINFRLLASPPPITHTYAHTYAQARNFSLYAGQIARTHIHFNGSADRNERCELSERSEQRPSEQLVIDRAH